MMHSADLETLQLQHMRAATLARPASPAEALGIRPLVPIHAAVAHGGNLVMNSVLNRPATGKPGFGARANLNEATLNDYQGIMSGGPNAFTWNLFNNMTV